MDAFQQGGRATGREPQVTQLLGSAPELKPRLALSEVDEWLFNRVRLSTSLAITVLGQTAGTDDDIGPRSSGA